MSMDASQRGIRIMGLLAALGITPQRVVRNADGGTSLWIRMEYPRVVVEYDDESAVLGIHDSYGKVRAVELRMDDEAETECAREAREAEEIVAKIVAENMPVATTTRRLTRKL